MGAGFSALYGEIHYIEVRYIKFWVYIPSYNFTTTTKAHKLLSKWISHHLVYVWIVNKHLEIQKDTGVASFIVSFWIHYEYSIQSVYKV